MPPLPQQILADAKNGGHFEKKTEIRHYIGIFNNDVKSLYDHWFFGHFIL